MRVVFTSFLFWILTASGAFAADEWIPLTYEGATGPEHWGALVPEYAVCAVGTRIER